MRGDGVGQLQLRQHVRIVNSLTVVEHDANLILRRIDAADDADVSVKNTRSGTAAFPFP